MNTPQHSQPETTNKEPRPRRRRSLISRLLLTLMWVLVAMLLLVLTAVTVAVNYLKPERLTPIVERLANENLPGADVSIGRIEISFWHTFPRFDLQVDSLTVLTKAFNGLPDSVRMLLPAQADTLLTLRGFSGAVNIPSLMAGQISLYDITLQSPALNLVQATPEVGSLDIFPPSAEEDSTDTPLFIPDITFGTFAITDGFPISYRSLPDSLDVSIALTTTRLDGDGAPVYRLSVDGLTSASVQAFTVNRLRLGVDGEIVWSPQRPYHATFSSVKAQVGEVAMTLGAEVDFADDIRVEKFTYTLPVTPLKDIIALVPTSMRGDIERLRPEASVAMGMTLTRPYTVGVDSIPSFDFTLSVPEGRAAYDGLSLDSFTLKLAASVDGDDLSRSTVNIEQLVARAPGIGFGITAKATDLLTDPYVKGTFKGGLGFAKLPPSILAALPGKVEGVLRADCEFSLRRSYLNRDNFHRILATGDVTLTDLDVDIPSIPVTLYSRNAELRLGTNTSFVRDTHSADSLLTVSLRVDTLSCLMDCIEARVGGFKAGVGTRNVASSADTTRINPIGGSVEVSRLLLRDLSDSTRVFLREATIGGALTRYKGNDREPQLSLRVSSGATFYGDSTMRVILRDLTSTMSVHPSDSPLQRQHRARLDSLRRLYPTLSRDSLNTLATSISRSSRGTRGARRAQSNQVTTTDTDDERISLEVDGSLRRILRRWNASGSLTAASARIFTPLFPLRTSVKDLSMRFSTDSVTVTETSVRLGRSDFRVNGAISNISRALTSLRGSQQLEVRFSLVSDTIDVNELAAATFAGAAYADSHSGAVYLGDADMDEQVLQTQVSSAAASVDTAGVLIIPANIEAELNVRARNILYSDLAFRDFHGRLNAFDGALNLSQLTARSDVGSLALNALYTAPTKHDASFAFDMAVKKLRIRQFLDLIPSIDSLMPVLDGIDGVIDASIAATSRLDTIMDIDIPSLKAAVKISGDSLIVMDDETYRTIGKWLLFKDKQHNMIDSMTVEMLIDNSRMQMFPFIFNIDRYLLGVEGSNDLAMNLNYHIAVLKSPIPFKFGINITGTADNMKIRLGRARFNEKSMPRTVAIADTTRINLVQQIRDVFRRGVSRSSVRPSDFISTSKIPAITAPVADIGSDTISAADSLYFIQQGLLPTPPAPPADAPPAPTKKKKSRK